MAIDGTYEVELTTTLGTEHFTLVLVTVGDVLNGMIDGYFGKQGFTGGRVEGNNLSWDIFARGPVGEMKLEVEATVDGDEITGQVKIGNFRPSPFKGKKSDNRQETWI